MFADDTNFFLSHKNIKEMFTKMNEELQKFNIWFKANKLSLNVDKTKFTLFHKASQSENLPLKLPDLFMNNTLIERRDSLKFLGIIIDETLSWKNHINIIESKLACAIGLLYRSRPFLDLNSRKLFYFSFVHSHLSYANIAWGATHPTKLHKLASQQRHVCKIIKCKGRRDSALPIMENLNILNIFNLNIYQVLIFMFKFTKKKLPTNFDTFFQSNRASRYNLRSSTKENFDLPKNTCKYVEHSLSYRGPKLWNSLYKEIKKAPSFNIFKRLLKNYLIYN